MRVKCINVFDNREYKYRILRVLWDSKVDYSSWFFSVSLEPKLWRWYKGFHEYRLTILGLAFHYRKSYGGLNG